MPLHDPPPNTGPFAFHQNFTRLGRDETQAAVRGLKPSGFKVWRWDASYRLVALLRMSERLLGCSPSENALALLTFPIGFERIAPGNMYANGGEFLGIGFRDLATSARSFDHGNSPNLHIP